MVETTINYKVTLTQPTIYVDDNGNVVNGHVVYFYLPAYNENHEIRVSSLNPNEVDKKVKAVIAWRDSLEKLGS